MNRFSFLVLVVLLLQLADCNILDPNRGNSSGSNSVVYQELSSGIVPPCLNNGGIPFQCVIKSPSDYDSLKIVYAPQGPYEDFTPDGYRTSFNLSYQPLGSGAGGKIEPGDLIIYLTGRPIYVQYAGRTIDVYSNPFYIYGDSILIFNDTTHGADGKIPCSLLFSVDSVSGEVTFVTPPNGGQLSMCAMRTLYPNYQGRSCNMDYFDFSKYSIIGMGVVGDGCLKGFDKQIFRNDSTKQIIYQYRLLEQQASGGCESDEGAFASWIQIARIPDGYTVVFQEKP